MRSPVFRTAVAAVAVAVSASSASAQSIYNLNGSLLDQNGAFSLASYGGTLGADGYSFGKNQGLSLSGVFNQSGYASGAYTIFIRATLNDVQNQASGYGYTKVIDFKNGTKDDGLYTVYGAAAGASADFIANNSENWTDVYPDVLQSNKYFVLALARSASGVTDVYVDGTKLWDLSFTDGTGAGLFTGPAGIAKFFIDDTSAGSDDGSYAGGSVDYIATYSSRLSDEAIRTYSADLPPGVTATPEPASMVLLATGLVGVIGAARRRKVAK